jgi:DNA-binding beta-propeller fold protein YncE
MICQEMSAFLKAGIVSCWKIAKGEKMKTKFQTFLGVILMSMIIGACAGSASPTVPPAPTAVPTEAIQVPSGIWEGAQEAGDNDWSLSLNFDGCTGSDPCAKVYYVLCAGEFAFQAAEAGKLLFQENITERPDQCFSGANVQVEYQGQDQPMIVSWMGDDGNAFTTAELHYQDPNVKPVMEGLGQQIMLFRNMGAVNWGFTASQGSLWIPEFNKGTVSRIDLNTTTILAEIKVGDPTKPSYNVDPNVVVVSGDRVWVTQRADKAVARIDPSTNAIVEVIPVEVEPFNLAIDGNFLWVTAYDEGIVLKVDTQTKEIIARVDIGAPSDVAVINDMVWVTEHRNGNVVLIDPQTVSIVEQVSLPTGSRPCSIAFLDGFVWVANKIGNSVSRIDLDTKEVATISLPQNAAQLTAGGGFIWVTLFPGPDAEMDLSKYAIAKINPQNNTVVEIIPFPGASNVLYLDGILWIDNRNDMSGDKLHGVKLMP